MEPNGCSLGTEATTMKGSGEGVTFGKDRAEKVATWDADPFVDLYTVSAERMVLWNRKRT